MMGVLNVTPDSFSDGGRYSTVDAAVQHGLAMIADGADIIDVGGESTRPGASRVAAEEEIRRVRPVVQALADAGAPVSIDTTRAAVAEAAVAVGAVMVNDVSGGLADPAMAPAIAGTDAALVLMHWRGHSAAMAELAQYDDVVSDVADELARRVEAALAAGVDSARLVIDPGLGFAKTAEHNWELLARLDRFVGTGVPVLVGASRKSFLGRLLADTDGTIRPAAQREDATVATSLLAAQAGVWGVRVHHVRPTVDALAVHGAVAAHLPMTDAHPVTAPAPGEVSLRGLRARGYHGVLESERRDGQDFLVDATVELDIGAAAGGDDLTATIDYATLASRLVAIVGGEPVQLIETLAEALAVECLSGHRVRRAEVTVHKPHAPIPHPFDDVTVRIVRARGNSPQLRQFGGAR